MDHHEKRGRQTFKRHISERKVEFPDFDREFGHLEGDTIVGRRHGSAVITLRSEGRKAPDIEKALNSMFSALPYRLFKSITFDYGKEFSSWKSISNQHDISIFFADPGTPSQRGLNEHSNGMLRRNGLDKDMDFNTVTDDYIIQVAYSLNN